MICKMSFDVRILYVHVNVTLTKFAIRLGPVSGGRSGNRCRLCIGKPLLMRKLEPRYDNPPLASSSLSILTKRFVLSIVKYGYMCVIGFLLKILHYSTIPYLFSLLLLFVGSEESRVGPGTVAKTTRPRHSCRRSWGTKRQRSLVQLDVRCSLQIYNCSQTRPKLKSPVHHHTQHCNS